MKLKNIMPIAILSGICIVVAVLMGVINSVTAPIIEKYEEQKVYDSLREVLDGEFEPVELTDKTPESVTGVYKVTDEDGNLKGNVVTIEKQGYASKICMTIGIDKDGKTTKVVVTAQQETHGKNIDSLINALSSGITAEEIDGVENITGATKTSEYIKSAIKDAFVAVGLKEEEAYMPIKYS